MDTRAGSEKAVTEKVAVDKAAVKAAADKKAGAGRTVVIQRPYGVTDSHFFVGFNNFEAQVAYDTPVTLPEAVVNHLKGVERVQYRADESGKPVAHYTKAFSVVNA